VSPTTATPGQYDWIVYSCLLSRTKLAGMAMRKRAQISIPPDDHRSGLTGLQAVLGWRGGCDRIDCGVQER